MTYGRKHDDYIMPITQVRLKDEIHDRVREQVSRAKVLSPKFSLNDFIVACIEARLRKLEAAQDARRHKRE